MDLIERAAAHLEKAKAKSPDPAVLEALSREEDALESAAVEEIAPPAAPPAAPTPANGAAAQRAADPLEADSREPQPAPELEPAAESEPAPESDADKGRDSGRGQRVELDFSKFAKSGLILPFGKSTQLTEEFRHIKRDVLTLRNLEDVPNSNMIMVTSAAPGEGKTHTAVNLAISIASERDLTALIIDADVTRPRVLDRLGVKADRGLIDLLDDPSLDVSDVMLKTNIETLSIIPAGPRHQRSTELLSSRRMREVATELAQRYNDRIIIFDTAPLLATTEPAILVKLVGQILVVVEAEKTTKGAITSAVEMIKGHQGVGFVLNKARPQIGASLIGGYYNYYSYGYQNKK